MSTSVPNVLALDFDGVICDGLIEYFQTAWRAYCRIWSPANLTPADDLAPTFYRLRPVVEVGWEMPVVLRALILGIPEAQIWQDWAGVTQKILQQDSLQASDIGKQVDSIRDEWIAKDVEDWLAQHRFYPGIIERLRAIISNYWLGTGVPRPHIITTKEGRFVRQLLQQQEINMPEEWIFGKEHKLPKHQILRELIDEYQIVRELIGEQPIEIWFVEDRLKTLQSVQQQADLTNVKLYLADWGYNTEQARKSVLNSGRIQLLSLSQFTQDFSAWD